MSNQSMADGAEERVSLAHGNGGRLMRELIDELFATELANPLLDTSCDAVALPPADGEWMITTDGFTVKPLEFPGGDIGSLAIHGTVNDLAVSGAVPRYLTLNAFIEEGLEFSLLRRLVASLGRAARESGVAVVAGDTKVVPRGEGSGVYFATTGVGVRRPGLRLAIDQIRAGDRLVVSGSVGDHGTSVLLAREAFGLRGSLRSDAASVLPLASRAIDSGGVRFMRDPTRGGLATVASEIARGRRVGVRLNESAIPVSQEVASVCGILGYDPLYLACEGRVVAVVAEEAVESLLAGWRECGAESAADIGEITDRDAGSVILVTPLGGERRLHELEEDPLPRIC